MRFKAAERGDPAPYDRKPGLAAGLNVVQPTPEVQPATQTRSDIPSASSRCQLAADAGIGHAPRACWGGA